MIHTLKTENRLEVLQNRFGMEVPIELLKVEEEEDVTDAVGIDASLVYQSLFEGNVTAVEAVEAVGRGKGKGKGQGKGKGKG